MPFKNKYKNPRVEHSDFLLPNIGCWEMIRVSRTYYYTIYVFFPT